MDTPKLNLAELDLELLEATYMSCMLGGTPSCAYVGAGVPGVAPGIYFRRTDGVVEYRTFEEYEREDREAE